MILMGLRLLISIIFIYHGWQKIIEPESARAFFGSVGFPEVIGPIMGWVEVGVGAFLFVGFWNSWANILAAAIMLVAIATVQAPAAYHSSVFLTAPLERDLLILLGALVLICQGPGILAWEQREV